MSNAFVVCQSAQGAVDVILALQKQKNAASTKPKETRHKNSMNASGYKKKTQERCQRGKTKPYERQRQNSIPRIVAPILNGVMILGDSIGLRLARQQKLFAPKHMKLCHGGATFASLLASLKAATEELNNSVIIMCGMNNALKNEEVSEPILRQIVEVLKTRNVNDIFIATIPPICRDLSKNEAIKQINTSISTLASPEDKLHIVEIFNLFLKEDQINDALYQKYYYSGALDLIHPNEDGLQIITDKIVEVVSGVMED